MIRPVTLTTYALALALGFGLFKVKYEVQSLEDNLIKVERQTALDTAAIHVYKASWSTETRPQALASLALRHLELKPMTPSEIGSYDTLPLSDGAPHLDTLPVAEDGPKGDLAASADVVPKAEETAIAKPLANPSFQLAADRVTARHSASAHAAIQLASLQVPPASAAAASTAVDASIDAVLQAMQTGAGRAQ